MFDVHFLVNPSYETSVYFSIKLAASAANWLQAKLDAPRAVTFDVTAACSGFIFALNVAEQYLKNKTFKIENMLSEKPDRRLRRYKLFS